MILSGIRGSSRDTTQWRRNPVSRRGEVLELAVLGLLHDSPMHGYELRKRLNAVLGAFRALSYGTLYPALKSLLAEGLIREAGQVEGPARALAGKRARIVYELTAEGKERFQSLVRQPGPAAWEDGTFDVHFAFFARTDAATRLQILEGRRSRLQERLDGVRQSMARTRERLDGYTLELQRHGLESVEREVRWLTELIDTERASNMTHLEDPDRPRRPATNAPAPTNVRRAERDQERRRTE
jgi:DNA-binding PadR family transcriptional regulator